MKAIQEKNRRRERDYIPGTTYDKEVDIAKAVEAPSKADAVVICLGEWANAETPGIFQISRCPTRSWSLTLRIMETKKAVILVLTEGRPRIINRIAASAKPL